MNIQHKLQIFNILDELTDMHNFMCYDVNTDELTEKQAYLLKESYDTMEDVIWHMRDLKQLLKEEDDE